MEAHWDAHKERLRAYIISKVDDLSAVDDILQEVYFKAHTRQHTLKSEESMGGWLYRIAYNTIMDHFRQQKPWEELPDYLEAPVEDESEQVYSGLVECLQPLMDELPDKYRLPLQLAELDGFTQKQVAEQLGLSLTAAKSRIQRARVKLRERYTDCCAIEVGRSGVTDYYPRDSQRSCTP
ncbi:RNA polymerase sigma factor SigZ [Parendozoicomonas haliclonae]|uniref:RNA polymerase sigma factor SigZ n=1 Tax=Parendozoicomonas haliclonae TaxID=1960125 RepID=A0A1X7ARH9_9GAMM|nr:RNA polymerase sigma factor SigZ [Parendozoicomonas haliclonae]SMA50698.1 ECF RNA polymerase sigma factor SigR [Parendozoicomonas haliclonae]